MSSSIDNNLLDASLAFVEEHVELNKIREKHADSDVLCDDDFNQFTQDTAFKIYTLVQQCKRELNELNDDSVL